MPFIEAVRQVIYEEGPENSMVIHLTLIPYLSATGELKTKPTQHSVKTLMELGLKADVLVCRSERDLSDEVKNCLLYTSPSPRDKRQSRMPSSA